MRGSSVLTFAIHFSRSQEASQGGENGKRQHGAWTLRRMTEMGHRKIPRRNYAPTENPEEECVGFLNVRKAHECFLGYRPCVCVNFGIPSRTSACGEPRLCVLLNRSPLSTCGHLRSFGNRFSVIAFAPVDVSNPAAGVSLE